MLDEEAEFSTGYDILAARLISVEMLLVYLSRRIERAARGDGTEAVPGKEHRWTDTKIAAIQLVYGIHAAGSVDNGNAEIGELAVLFEKTFHVDLGNVYHAFGRLPGTAEPDGVLGRDEGEAAEEDAGHGQQVIGKSAASWQRSGRDGRR